MSSFTFISSFLVGDWDETMSEFRTNMLVKQQVNDSEQDAEDDEEIEGAVGGKPLPGN